MSADQPEWSAPPEAVIAFLDGDGCDDEAFASLRRRLTLATPWILDSAAGTDYTARKLAETEKRGAVKALRREAERGMEAAENAAKMDTPNRDFALALMRGLARELDHRASLIESGEVTLP